jgi:potassium-transporting ATPase KdpC subunit
MGRQIIRPALMVFLALTLATGVVYPLALTGIAQLAFPFQSNGSLLVRDGKPLGSALLGQSFSSPGYFWGRPSATSPPDNAASSTGSNLGPTNPALVEAVRARVQALRAADPGNKAPIPVDLVTTSASGLDPDISPAAGEYQVRRVARARGLTEQSVGQLVAAHTEARTWGLLGEPRVNVVQLNLALDDLGR